MVRSFYSISVAVLLIGAALLEEQSAAAPIASTEIAAAYPTTKVDPVKNARLPEPSPTDVYWRISDPYPSPEPTEVDVKRHKKKKAEPTEVPEPEPTDYPIDSGDEEPEPTPTDEIDVPEPTKVPEIYPTYVPVPFGEGEPERSHVPEPTNLHDVPQPFPSATPYWKAGGSPLRMI
ncbi:hypothetical protein BGZ72_000329 [Mortierella alpina]|nr:hypothetical protein BGZ72_000329 [Mortierella alpina]